MHPKIQRRNSSVVPKGWGEELIIVNNDEYCGKLLKFKKGSKFSMHAHIKKLETFYVLSGLVQIEGVNTENASRYYFTLTEGEAVDIERFAFHQVTALKDSVIIEFSTPHLDEDSYRVEEGDSQKLNL